MVFHKMSRQTFITFGKDILLVSPFVIFVIPGRLCDILIIHWVYLDISEAVYYLLDHLALIALNSKNSTELLILERCLIYHTY
jgi:hypothetical protein